MLETDLYLPLKTWFENQGFEVRGEVNHCDLVAQRGDDLVVVELKLKPSLKLLYQAADRLQCRVGDCNRICAERQRLNKIGRQS